MEMVDVYIPKIEGMDKIEQKRRVTAMETILSKVPFDEDGENCKLMGYQKPEPKEERPHQKTYNKEYIKDNENREKQ